MTIATTSEQLLAHQRGDKAGPGVVVMDRPDGSWTPLRFAPFFYQASPHPLENPRMSQGRIGSFVRTSVKDPSIIECTIHWKTIGFSISYLSHLSDDEDDTDFTHFMPYDARKEFSTTNGGLRDGCQGLVEKVESVWSEMERRFRNAVMMGHCKMLARCDRPHAPHFTEVAPEIFGLFEIKDWKSGFAESAAGDRLYAIHVAPPPSAVRTPIKFETDVAPPKKQEAKLEPKQEATGEPMHQEAKPGSLKKSASAMLAYSVKQAALVANMGRSSLYTAIKDGHLIARKSGRHTVILARDLEAFLANLPASG
jgi:hypothetical protein